MKFTTPLVLMPFALLVIADCQSATLSCERSLANPHQDLTFGQVSGVVTLTSPNNYSYFSIDVHPYVLRGSGSQPLSVDTAIATPEVTLYDIAGNVKPVERLSSADIPHPGHYQTSGTGNVAGAKYVFASTTIVSNLKKVAWSVSGHVIKDQTPEDGTLVYWSASASCAESPTGPWIACGESQTINQAATTITESSGVTLPDTFEMEVSTDHPITKSLGLVYSGAATTAFTAFKLREQPADGITLGLSSSGMDSASVAWGEQLSLIAEMTTSAKSGEYNRIIDATIHCP
ncbi:hypothetical protein NX790_21210 [Enterobacter asburiae]|uniref:hypothetical protein n=1 Tax=Enterobacter asburiae TaxID=61645 RepID=UPI002175A562|nr:hypothetical protein [Enterobacter asburiae]MCS5456941.1 hypothetical protein [Enterobacter asburiae]